MPRAADTYDDTIVERALTDAVRPAILTPRDETALRRCLPPPLGVPYRATEGPRMSRFLKLGIIFILVGAFLPLFFRVGWEETYVHMTARGQVSARTGVIVWREETLGELTDEEKQSIRSEYTDYYDIYIAEQQAIKRNGSPRIEWPARHTDVLGLTVAFAGVLMVASSLMRRRKTTGD